MKLVLKSVTIGIVYIIKQVIATESFILVIGLLILLQEVIILKLFCKFIVLIISSLLIAGCSEQDEYDDKKQLLEVSIPSGEVIRQTTDNKTITELVKREKIEQWEEIEAIPPMSEALYIFTSYEAITDPLFLENDEAFDISMGKMTLYKNDKNYYIEYYIESAIDYMQIPTSAGEYLE